MGITENKRTLVDQDLSWKAYKEHMIGDIMVKRMIEYWGDENLHKLWAQNTINCTFVYVYILSQKS